MNKKHLRAQTTLEYAVMIAVIVAALIAMQVYVKRGVQGGMRVSWDNIGEQYNPARTEGNANSSLTLNTVSSTAKGLSTFDVNQHQEKNTYEHVGR